MNVWLRRLYRFVVATVLTVAILIFGPAPEQSVTGWTAPWIFLVCLLWAGFAGQIGERALQLFRAQTGRGELALSLAILCLGFTLIVFIWMALAGTVGFWLSVFAMVPVFGIYALIDWIVRHRDDFDTRINP